MDEVSIGNALLLWDSPLLGKEPRFAVRPLGHRDYDRYTFKVGACFADWQRDTDLKSLKLRLMVEVWHIAAFYDLPIELMKPELLRILAG